MRWFAFIGCVAIMATPAMAAEKTWEPYKRMNPPQTTDSGGHHQHHWKIGEHIPRNWKTSHDVNWRSQHLSAPPRGDHWVKDGNEYVLARGDGLVLKVTVGR